MTDSTAAITVFADEQKNDEMFTVNDPKLIRSFVGCYPNNFSNVVYLCKYSFGLW